MVRGNGSRRRTCPTRDGRTARACGPHGTLRRDGALALPCTQGDARDADGDGAHGVGAGLAPHERYGRAPVRAQGRGYSAQA